MGKKKKIKIAIGVIIAVLVVSTVVLAGQSELFQGRLRIFRRAPVITRIDYSRLYLLRDTIVSAVTSPVTSGVPSIVVSEVTSPEGISEVASVVVSPVGSAVASAVAVDSETAKQADNNRLQALTAQTLESISRQDYIANPSFFMRKAEEDYESNPEKFSLSEKEKQEILRVYEIQIKPAVQPIRQLPLRRF